ncbi:MAG: molybdenum cofactor guanylyltransferase [Chloroflexota bacterium]
MILAGGHGSRLGGINKAMLVVGTASIVERTLAAVQPIVGEVTLVVNDHSLASLGLPLYLDPEPHAGVLPALLTGLEASSAELCLLTACDMPFIQPRLVEHLFEACAEHDVCLPYIERRPEPMLAVYRRERCIGAIREALSQGYMRMIAFLDRLNVAALDESDLRYSDPELRSFFNVNEPADLEQARQMALEFDHGHAHEALRDEH